MATLGPCMFCKAITAFHTHDKCVDDYGKPIEERIQRHYRETPTLPLPQEITQELTTAEWEFYVKRKKRDAEYEAHVNKIEADVRKEAHKILNEMENVERLRKQVVDFGHIDFQYSFELKVHVRRVPRC